MRPPRRQSPAESPASRGDNPAYGIFTALTRREVVIWVLAVGVLAVNFVNATASIILGSVLSAYIILKAKPEDLLPLLLLTTSRADFTTEYGTVDQGYEMFDAGSLMVAGIPFSIAYVMMAMIPVRIALEVFGHPQTFRADWVRGLLFISLLLLPLALWEAFLSRSIGLWSWTLSVRSLLLTMAFFYGFIIAKNWPERSDFIVRGLVGLAVPLLLFAITGHYFSRIMSLVAALLPPMALLGILRGTWPMKGWSLVALVLVALYALGFGSSAIRMEGGIMGKDSGNFTLNLLLVAGVTLGGLVLLVPAMIGRWMVPAVALTAMLSIALPVAIGLGWNPVAIFVPTGAQSEVAQRLEGKIIGERGHIWAAAIQQIQGNPPIVTIPGQPLILEGFQSSLTFGGGAHNAYIESFRQFGWVLGSWMMIMLALSAVTSAYVIVSKRSRCLVVLAVGIVVQLLITAPVVHYLACENIGLWHFGLAGAIFSLSYKPARLVN